VRWIATRALAGLLSAAFIWLLLLVVGIDPWHLWADYRASRVAAVPARAEDASVPEAPVAVVQPQPIGTDSSISTAPARLLLRETRPGRNAGEGYAEVGISALSPQTYRAGAVLANGARIEEIRQDFVVLTRGTEHVRLYVQGREPAGASPPDSALLYVGGTSPSPADNAVPDSEDALTDFMRVSPVYQGDAVHAIEVYANDRSSVFFRLGLEPGDRITSINGEAVSDAATAIATLRRLAQGEAMQVIVERSGELRSLTLDGVVVAAARSAPTG
jgi:general secretion pathway protein C